MKVIAAQTRLAQEIYRRPEFYNIYLAELLNLFIFKGISIQNAVIENRHLKVQCKFLLALLGIK